MISVAVRPDEAAVHQPDVDRGIVVQAGDRLLPAF